VIIKFNKFYESVKDDFFYYIRERIFLICDISNCAKSNKTFDIKFDDLVANKELINILFPKFNVDYRSSVEFAEYLTRFDNKKVEKLLNNPKLRILVQDPDLFIDVLTIFRPDDIRVKIKKYNI